MFDYAMYWLHRVAGEVIPTCDAGTCSLFQVRNTELTTMSVLIGIMIYLEFRVFTWSKVGLSNLRGRSGQLPLCLRS